MFLYWYSCRSFFTDVDVVQAAAFEKDPAATFWGDNYQRLLEIKRKIDPHDVFWCSPCVGNEGWEQKDDGRLCRVREDAEEYGMDL